MQYRNDRSGNALSVLGYGCMRFSRSGGRLDLKKAEREVLAAVAAGVNYFDTAYVYPGSEALLGEILHRNRIREQVYIATKLPHYLIKSADSPEKFFAEELRRLQTSYVDYYLMHMLTDVDTWERLRALGVEDWLAAKKRSGAIRQVGFSYHGNAEMFCRLVDAYPWDFCQIQYNYMDENTQAGRRGLQYAAQKGLPVIIMEPLRGGKLADQLPAEAAAVMAAHTPQRTPAQWALHWLWDQPEVTCVLSGMHSMEMVQENTAAADEAAVGALTAADAEMLRRVTAVINAKTKVGCTGCGYCMPCPQHVDISGTFANYNRRYTDGWFVAMREHVMCTALRRTSSAASCCVECGKCEARCPQHIPIRSELRHARKVLEGPIYRIARRLIRLVRAY